MKTWLGGNWARGRAYEKGIWKQDPDHNFCAILSGAIGFEWRKIFLKRFLYSFGASIPCCPGTLKMQWEMHRTEKGFRCAEKGVRSTYISNVGQGEILIKWESIG
ncbi:MAG: hypothetical protein R2784_16775 [Saprospiraceae bacterium]